VSGAALQAFSNVAVVVKPGTIGATGVDTITLLDPTDTAQIAGLPRGVLAEISTGGTNSGAVAVDPAQNWALVANAGSNDISVVSLGSSYTPQISRISIPSQAALPSSQRLFPQGTPISGTDLPVKIFGAGFSGSPQVRLDGTVIAGATLMNSREIDVTIPASYLAAPRRYALDVVVGSNISNVTDFTVVGVVDMTSAGCITPQPAGVAIDDVREKAVVANSGCNTISIIDLNTATAGTPIAVGTAPLGVATIPRLGLAVVTNSNMNLATGASNGAGTVSVVDVAAGTVQAPLTVGTDPTGVAINQDTGIAYAVNTGSNTLSAIDLTAATPTVVTGAVDQTPISIAVDPNRNIAVVGAILQNSNPPQGVLDVVDTSLATPAIKSRVSASPSLPTGVVYDPANGLFYAVASLSNSFYVLNPDSTGPPLGVRVGVNPTSLAYNPQSGTLVTVNSASNTLSFVDTLTMRTREALGFGTATPATTPSNPQFAAAIHPRTNLAVITDAANNRVLLLPLPR
jgi:YVTN family beta-propeller protein